MGLTLIIGPSGSGKTYYATRQIAQTAADRIDRPVIYITPDQMTLKTEQTLMEAIGTNSLLGMKRSACRRSRRLMMWARAWSFSGSRSCTGMS